MKRIFNKDSSVEFVLSEEEMQVVVLALENLKTSLPLGGDESNV